MARFTLVSSFAISCVVVSTASCGDTRAVADQKSPPGSVTADAYNLHPPLPSSVVALVDDVAITRADLDREGSDELRRLHREVEEVERRALDRLIDNALVVGEATRRGATVAQLLESVDYLDGLASPDDDQPNIPSRDPVVERYRRQQQLRDVLRQKRDVRVFLKPAIEVIDLSAGVTVGPVEAPIELVEFSAYSCPQSAALFRNLDRLHEELGSGLRWTSIDVYGGSSGQHARLALRAGRCAAAQGKLLEIRRALFEPGAFEKAARDGSTLRSLAERAGLDPGAFARCTDAGPWEAERSRSAREARRAGVAETPAVFINGRRLMQPATLEAIRNVVRAEVDQESQSTVGSSRH